MQRDVVEDPEPEVDQGHQVQVEAEPIADEGEDDRDDRVRDEAADEDPIVVDAVELGADGPEDRIERGEDRHGRVPGELEADVDVEDEPESHAQQETRQGEEHASPPSLRCVSARLPDRTGRRHTTRRRPGRSRTGARSRAGARLGRRLRDVGAVAIVAEDDRLDRVLAPGDERRQELGLAGDQGRRPLARAVHAEDRGPQPRRRPRA